MQQVQEQTQENLEIKYEYTIELDKKYKVRKWKAKEKKEFLNLIKKGESLDALADILVYNCIEGKAAFNADEFKYFFSKMRQISLGNEINLEFYCDECKSKFLKTIELDKIIKPLFSNIKDIKTKNYTIKIGTIRNSDFYKQIISSNPENSNEYDFYLRISSINSNDSMTLEEIVNLFDNMDIDEFDSIFEQWENMRFKIDDTTVIECNNCSHSVRYSFDEVPGFFPSSWFK